MSMHTRSSQRGLSFLGLLFIGGLVAVVSVVALQVTPTVIEYRAVTDAAIKASAGKSVAEVRTIFDKMAQVNDIKSITGKDLDISKQGDRVVVGFEYEREIHLAGPAYLTLKYSGSTQ